MCVRSLPWSDDVAAPLFSYGDFLGQSAGSGGIVRRSAAASALTRRLSPAVGGQGGTDRGLVWYISSATSPVRRSTAMARDEKKRKKKSTQLRPDGDAIDEDVKIKKKNIKHKKPRLPTPPPVTVATEEEDLGDNKKAKKNKNKRKARKENCNAREIDDVEHMGEKESKESKNEKNSLITDARFAVAHFDPRFQRMPKRESKVVIDSRFTRMFSDKNFDTSAAPVDKRGKRKKGKTVNPLLHYYLQQEGEEENHLVNEGSAKVQREERPPRSLPEGSGSESEVDVSVEEGEKGSDDDEEEQRSASSSDDSGSTDDDDIEDDEVSSVFFEVETFWLHYDACWSSILHYFKWTPVYSFDMLLFLLHDS
ncbi:hypothetical protein BHM03_00017490 [Ensete ventricosum]|nr:hypothetical protein BHM03_00017490 [Ensete ventricosum]